MLHIRVGVLVDRDRGGRVRDVDDGHPVLDVVLRDQPPHVIGHLEHLPAGLGLQGQGHDREMVHGLNHSSQSRANGAW